MTEADAREQVLPAEPIDTAIDTTQRSAEVTEIIHAPPSDQQVGIKRSTAEAFLSVLKYSSMQTKDMVQIWARGVDDEKARLQKRGDDLHDALTKEKILNARMDERLRGGQFQSAGQLLLANVGGGFFGYGIGDDSLFWIIGLVFIIFGSWPTVSARWWPK